MNARNVSPSMLKFGAIALIVLAAVFLGATGRKSSWRQASLNVIRTQLKLLQEQLDWQRISGGPTLRSSETDH